MLLSSRSGQGLCCIFCTLSCPRQPRHVRIHQVHPSGSSPPGRPVMVQASGTATTPGAAHEGRDTAPSGAASHCQGSAGVAEVVPSGRDPRCANSHSGRLASCDSVMSQSSQPDVSASGPPKPVATLAAPVRRYPQSGPGQLAAALLGASHGRQQSSGTPPQRPFSDPDLQRGKVRALLAASTPCYLAPPHQKRFQEQVCQVVTSRRATAPDPGGTMASGHVGQLLCMHCTTGMHV